MQGFGVELFTGLERGYVRAYGIQRLDSLGSARVICISGSRYCSIWGV